MHTVGEVMRKHFEVCTPDTVVSEMLYLIKCYDYDDLFVVDNMREQHLVGVVHASQLSDEALKNEVHPFQLSAKNFMVNGGRAPTVVSSATSVHDCLSLMQQGGWLDLPVIDDSKKICGVVKKSDLISLDE